MRMTSIVGVLGLAGIVLTSGMASAASHKSVIKRGRYLVEIGGCNDCHTAGYMQTAGKVPQSKWLMGDTFGWTGPWGTTYAPNLRLFMAGMTEEQWVKAARTLRKRPPMPWYDVNKMHTSDLRAIYVFVRSLGAPGKPAPAYLPPGQTPPGPHALFPSPPPKGT